MIDHLLWAVPDLEEGCRELARQTGVEAVRGGRHLGVGTHNALAGLGGERYLELIALDPTQEEQSSLGLLLGGLRRPGLLTWCARTRDLAAVASAARLAGCRPGEPVAMSRQLVDGGKLEWRLLFLDGAGFLGEDGGELLVPFFIDWGETPHPSRSVPKGCRLERFVLHHPAPERLGRLLRALGLEVEVAPGPAPRLVARLDTPRGRIELGGPPSPGASAFGVPESEDSESSKAASFRMSAFSVPRR